MRRLIVAVLTSALVIAPFLTNVANVYAVTSSSSVAPDFMWSNAGPGGQELSSPYGLAVAPNGNVYVADMGNAVIKEFTRNGTFVTLWGEAGTGDGQFSTPIDIAVASNGNVYVLDVGDDIARVEVFTSDGTFLSSWGSYGGSDGQFILPLGLAIAPNGNVYVTDLENGVQEFTGNGTFVTKWSIGSSPVTAYGIAVSKNGDVYVALLAEGVVQRYSADGTFISSWGGIGSGDGQFGVGNGDSGFGPVRLTITDNGHVYVTDGGNNRVQEFTSDGTFVAKWGMAGSGAGQFSTPFGITSDANGNMYVADYGNNRIQRYFFPQNISNITAGANEIGITLPQGCDISNHSILTPNISDGLYSYPIGLTSFTFSTPDCVSGATVPVTMTFQTDLKPTDVVARKYNTNTQTYATIPDAIITETTVDGQHALQLSYSVTDGGPLDEDGIANGVIVDPVGLGTLTNTLTIGAPNTGIGPVDSFVQPNNLFAIVTLFVVVVFGFWLHRFAKR